MNMDLKKKLEERRAILAALKADAQQAIRETQQIQDLAKQKRMENFSLNSRISQRMFQTSVMLRSHNPTEKLLITHGQAEKLMEKPKLQNQKCGESLEDGKRKLQETKAREECDDAFKSELETSQRKNVKLDKQLEEGKAQYAALLQEMDETQKNSERQQLECHKEAMDLNSKIHESEIQLMQLKFEHGISKTK